MTENPTEGQQLADAAQPALPRGPASTAREIKPIQWGTENPDFDFRPTPESYEPEGLEDVRSESEVPNPKDSSVVEPVVSSSSGPTQVTQSPSESKVAPASPATPDVEKVSTPKKATSGRGTQTS